MSTKKNTPKTRRLAIRNHCKECAGSPKEVTLCPIPDCHLFPYRMGLSPQQHEERVKRAREKYPDEWQELQQGAEELGLDLASLGPARKK